MTVPHRLSAQLITLKVRQLFVKLIRLAAGLCWTHCLSQFYQLKIFQPKSGVSDNETDNLVTRISSDTAFMDQGLAINNFCIFFMQSSAPIWNKICRKKCQSVTYRSKGYVDTQYVYNFFALSRCNIYDAALYNSNKLYLIIINLITYRYENGSFWSTNRQRALFERHSSTCRQLFVLTASDFQS